MFHWVSALVVREGYRNKGVGKALKQFALNYCREKKEELHNRFNADICEMEAAGIVLTSNRNKVPCLMIKTVSDSITGGAEEFRCAIDESARICMEITSKIISTL